MREFHLLYRDLPNVQPLVAGFGWTHNLTNLQRCKEPLERKFYSGMTRKTVGTPALLRRCFDRGQPRSVTARGDIGIRRTRGRDE